MGEIQTIPKMVGLRHWVYHISYFAVSCFKSLKITAVESTSRFCGRQKVMPLFVDTVWQRPMNPILKEWRKKPFSPTAYGSKLSNHPQWMVSYSKSQAISGSLVCLDPKVKNEVLRSRPGRSARAWSFIGCLTGSPPVVSKPNWPASQHPPVLRCGLGRLSSSYPGWWFQSSYRVL